MSASAADPRKLLGAGCDKWGTERLALAIIVRNWLDKAQHSWFIESGTLLGAWRNGRFIAHDDDFDIALVIDTEDVTGELQRQCDIMSAALPAPYECRVTSSYCDKIEVFDPTHGDYALLGDQYLGARFHYVTIDLQAREGDSNLRVPPLSLPRPVRSISADACVGSTPLPGLCPSTVRDERCTERTEASSTLSCLSGGSCGRARLQRLPSGRLDDARRRKLPVPARY